MTNTPARMPAAERRAERKAGDAAAPIVRTEPVLSSPLSSGVVILAVLALIAALYIGKEVVLPIALAIVLKLLLQPVLNFLCTYLRLPTAVGALILICGLFAAIGAVAFTVSGPASGWIEKAPKVLPAIKEKLVPLRQPIEYVQNAFKEIEDAAAPAGQGEKAPAVAVKDHSEMAGKLALGTLTMMGRLLATMVVLFFLLAAGDRLLRGFIEVLPTFSDKRQAAGIASEIQRQIGGYLITISLMNFAVGVVAGLAMWACGLGDPVLWGAFAFLLNYVPIMGPLTGIGVLLVAGIVTLDWPWPALLPAACYTMIHIAEGEVITPLLLAKRFTLNPVVVIVSLFFWHALWGIPGALLAVPLLAMFKIICDRVEPLQPVGHIIGA
jgi:predicted PurR-regulated permease PerM